MAKKKQLTRSTENKMIAGVVAGFAEYMDADVTGLRLLYAAITIFTGFIPGVLFYILAVFIMPPSKAKEL